MSSLTRAFTMAASTGSQWRPQRELETRAKVSETFHVCGRRLSILPATRQAPRDETSCEFKGLDGCTIFLFSFFSFSSFLRWGKMLEQNCCGLEDGQTGAGLRYRVGRPDLSFPTMCLKLCFFIPRPFANFFHRFKLILDTCLRLEYRNIEVRIEKSVVFVELKFDLTLYGEKKKR